MQCPVCANQTLVMSERSGIEIDYCPGCRGVWLDRGELDKILERAAQTSAPAPQPAQAAPAARPQAYDTRGHDDHHREHARPRRRKSFLEELFD